MDTGFATDSAILDAAHIDLAEASRALDSYVWGMQDAPQDPDNATSSNILRSRLEAAWLKLLGLLHRRGLEPLIAYSTSRWAELRLAGLCEYSGPFANADYHSTAVQFLNDLRSTIALHCFGDMTTSVEASGLLILERVLRGVGRASHSRGVAIESEAVLQELVDDYLSTCFSDYIPQHSIPYPGGGTRTDGSIPLLRTAIELKFVSKREGVKRIKEEIKADIAGYGVHNWARIYALVCMTEPFVTEDQLQEFVSAVDGGKRWTMIAVVLGAATSTRASKASLRGAIASNDNARPPRSSRRQ